MASVARKKTNQLIDKSIFSVFALAGASSIIVFRVFDISITLSIFTPILLLLAYALLTISQWSRFRLRYDQAGDNCYYLGFIYTLISLGIALYRFDRSTPGTADEIIKNFGIALATTIVGIALRVILHQMREDPMDVEAASRRELRDEAARVTGQLTGMVRDVAVFRARTQDELKHFAYETQQSAEEYRDSIKTFSEQSRELSAQIEEIVDQIHNIAIPKDFLDKKIDPVVSTMDQIVQKTEQILSNEGTRQQVLTNLLAGAGQAVAQIGSIVESLAQLRDMPGNVARATDEIGKTIEAMAPIQKNLLGAVERIEAAAQQQVQVTKQSLESVSDTVGSTVQRLERDMGQRLEAISEAMNKLGAAADALVGKLNNAADQFEKLKSVDAVLDRIERIDSERRERGWLRLFSR